MAWLENQVRLYEQYRASFTPDQLKMPAVWGDPTGAGKRRLDADIAAIRGQVPVGREARQAHLARLAPRTLEAMAAYDLTNIQPGPAERAMKVKYDPTFPDASALNSVQAIAVSLSFGPKPTGAQLDWKTKAIEGLDLPALAALIR